MRRKRLLLPNARQLRKWLRSVFNKSDSTGEEAPDVLQTGANIIYMGDGYGQRKDPEHLPAANAWQHFGNVLRKISRFLGSQESGFGFRVACATMTIGIVCFLEPTQLFFQEQRLVWAMIIVAIGMTQSELSICLVFIWVR